MRYLKGTMSYGICYTGHPKVLEGYCDANQISYVDELYATSGFVFSLGGGAIFWKSCKQTILTKSTIVGAGPMGYPARKGEDLV